MAKERLTSITTAIKKAHQNIDTGWAFLTENRRFNQQSLLPKNPQPIQNRIAVYGTMNAITNAVLELHSMGVKDTEIYNPTQKPEIREKYRYKAIVGESENLMTSNTKLVMLEGDTGGGIGQMEIRAAALDALISGTNLVVRVEIPKPVGKDEERGNDKNKIWRSRMMALADLAYLKTVFQDKLNLYISTNDPSQLPEALRATVNNISESHTDALTHAREILNLETATQFTTPATHILSHQVVISGSSRQEDASQRKKIGQALLQEGILFQDTSLNFVGEPIPGETFANELPLSRLLENDRVTGRNISGQNKDPLTPDVNIVQISGSYGDLSQAMFAILNAVANGTQVILYLPSEITQSARQDLMTFQSHLRQIALSYPQLLYHIQIAENPEDITPLITNDLFPQETVARAAEIGHELWKAVYISQQSQKTMQPTRFKPLFVETSERDKQTAKGFLGTQALHHIDDQEQIDILQVPLANIPEDMHIGTLDSVKVALQTVDKHSKSGIRRVLSKRIVLERMAVDVGKVEHALKKQERGELLTRREQRRLRKSWVVTEGGFNIHALWESENVTRFELQKAYIDLDPYEQHKDIVYIQAAIQARGEAQIRRALRTGQAA